MEAGEWRLAALDVRTRIRSREIQLAKRSGTRSVPSREVRPRRILFLARSRPMSCARKRGVGASAQSTSDEEVVSEEMIVEFCR